jgi:hypothetical protein
MTLLLPVHWSTVEGSKGRYQLLILILIIATITKQQQQQLLLLLLWAVICMDQAYVPIKFVM